ncbi:MAG: Imm26 family immunity protein [Muribaculum sp.]|nr:Imm26 family immunity protein [Muribaculum sp.]
MSKRVIVRTGNVFCVEIDNKYKCFFQYVCKDKFMLNGQVIKVFKTRYSMDYVPVLKEIVCGEVAFYAHTLIRAGLYFNAWYKVGHSSIVSNDHEKILWGIAKETLYAFDITEDIYVDPMKNWILWFTNEVPFQFTGELPEKYRDVVEYGSLMAFVDIVNRIRLGYYLYQSCVYNKLKRIPHPEIDSYTKIEDIDKTIYSHFKGESVIQEITIFSDGKNEMLEGKPLDRPKFWETNWKRKELILKEEFEEVWNK